MKLRQIAAAVIFLLPPLRAFAAKPDPADYKLEIHVRDTQLGFSCSSTVSMNPLNCGVRLFIVGILDGQKLQLRANSSFLLRTGDYKMKEKKDDSFDPPPSYVDQRAYEMLLPDGKTMTFQVVGESRDE